MKRFANDQSNLFIKEKSLAAPGKYPDKRATSLNTPKEQFFLHLKISK